jgi:hypothetical protein
MEKSSVYAVGSGVFERLFFEAEIERYFAALIFNCQMGKTGV